MGDVLTFTPRPQPAVPDEPRPMTEAEIRERLGVALQTTLDAADHIIAILDRMDGCPDLEDGADAEPSLAAPENHHEAQTTWMCGNDGDREAEAAEIMLPEVAIEPWPFPWSGRENALTACGAALLTLVGG